MIREVKAPQCYFEEENEEVIFLAGTIDNGNSEDWQSKLIKSLLDRIKYNVVFLNPRRENWDPNSSTEELEKQIDWELRALSHSTSIIMNFLPDSKSPITLLELGLYARSGKLLVVCPEEFYRSTNVRMVCERYDVPMYETIEELIERNF